MLNSNKKNIQVFGYIKKLCRKIIYSNGYGCYQLLLLSIAKSVSTFKQSNAIKQPTLWVLNAEKK